MSEQDTLDKSQEEWQEEVESLALQLHESEESVCNTGDALEAAAETINGWDCDRSTTFAENVKAMAGVLVAAIKERDARINRLLLKLGQAVEKL